MVVWWLVGVGHAFPASLGDAACGERGVALQAVESAVLEGRWDDVEPASDALVAAFGCGALADPADVARTWLAEALLRSTKADDASADDALWAAAHVAPTTWNDLYGPRLRTRWAAAALRAPPASGSLNLGLPVGWVGAVDGAVVSFPAPVPGGLHLVQVGASQDAVFTARIVEVPPGVDVWVPITFPPATPATAPGDAPVSHRSRRVVHALIVGGVSAGVYGATFATSSVYEAQDPAARSEGLRLANNGLIVGGSALALTSGVLLVRGLATTR